MKEIIPAAAHGQLVKYDAMCAALAACNEVDEVKAIRDKALALQVYAAQAMNLEAERQACMIRLRAERRTGELLAEMKETGQRATAKQNLKKGKVPKSVATTSEKTLKDLGISKDQASKWQQLAEVPEKEFEVALSDPKTKLSTAALIAKRAGKQKTKASSNGHSYTDIDLLVHFAVDAAENAYVKWPKERSLKPLIDALLHYVKVLESREAGKWN